MDIEDRDLNFDFEFLIASRSILDTEKSKVPLPVAPLVILETTGSWSGYLQRRSMCWSGR